MSDLIKLHDSLYMFDLFEQGQAGRSSAYLFNGPKKVLIETGSAVSHDHIVDSLAHLSLTPEDLDYVIITHVHLDHAGGAGKLAQLAKKATFVAHPRAARHLIDPSKLILGATQVYGDDMKLLFGDIIPIPEKQVLIREEGESIDIGDRKLVFIDTPGHAKHHFVIHDPETASVFSGDSLGIRYVKAFTGWDFEFVLPSTSPTDFDPAGVAYTVDRIKKLAIDTVYHTHFGPSPAEEAFRGTLEGAMAFKELSDRIYTSNPSWEGIQNELSTFIRKHLQDHGHHPSDDLEELTVDLELNAKGLLVYEQRKSHHA